MSDKIPLIYIVGSSHSGSTLLDLLLGSHSSIQSVGEAKKIPELRAQISRGGHPVCTCRQELTQCPFWAELLSRDFGDLQRDARAIAPLYARILEKQKKSVLLDSSKVLGRALLFARSGLFDPLFVHLVRDSRAIVFSNKRKKTKNKGRGHGLIETARGWDKLNARISQRLGGHRLTQVRYEDLTESPARVLRSILAESGLKWEEPMLRFRDHVHHNIEGNRMRMGSQSEIKRDGEYLCSLSDWEWRLTTLLTWRRLRKFGYPLKRSPVTREEGGTTPSLA